MNASRTIDRQTDKHREKDSEEQSRCYNHESSEANSRNKCYYYKIYYATLYNNTIIDLTSNAYSEMAHNVSSAYSLGILKVE